MSPEVAAARDRFWAAHLEEARGIVDRAVARGELPAGTDPAALIDLVIGPAVLRLRMMGQDLGTHRGVADRDPGRQGAGQPGPG